MDTFDDLIGKAKNLMDVAGRKTSDAVEIAKLKMNRMQVNAEIQKTYEKLGAFVYKFHKTGEENKELIEVCVGEIDGLLQQLNDIANRINTIKATLRCPECGSVNDDEAYYCTKCGARMERAEEKDASAATDGAPPIILTVNPKEDAKSASFYCDATESVEADAEPTCGDVCPCEAATAKEEPCTCGTTAPCACEASAPEESCCCKETESCGSCCCGEDKQEESPTL